MSNPCHQFIFNLVWYVILLNFPSGGKLVYLYTKKVGSVPKCGDCKLKLRGVCICTSYEILPSERVPILFYSNYSQNKKILSKFKVAMKNSL